MTQQRASARARLRRRRAASLIAFAVLTVLALGCGKYGPPRRSPPAQPAQVAPSTEQAADSEDEREREGDPRGREAKE